MSGPVVFPVCGSPCTAHLPNTVEVLFFVRFALYPFRDGCRNQDSEGGVFLNHLTPCTCSEFCSSACLLWFVGPMGEGPFILQMSTWSCCAS